MKKFWLLALLCCVCAAAISCNDDDEVVADDNEGTTSQTTSYGLTGSHGFYYGDYYTSGTALEYFLIISDWDMTETYYKEGYHYYNLAFYSTTEPASSPITVPAGTYTVSGTEGNNVIHTEVSKYVVYGSDGSRTTAGLSDGSLTVSVSGTTTTIEGTLTDEEGTVHNISYSGTIDIYDISSDTGSFLADDIETDLSGNPCEAYYYGDKLGNGTAYWDLGMLNTSGGENLYLTLCANSSYTADKGLLPTGTFTGAIAANAEAGNYIEGILSPEYLDYSLYFNVTTDGYLTAPYSTLEDGTATVTDNGDGAYTINVDVKDASGNYSIKVSWTGTPTIIDASENIDYSAGFYYGDILTDGTTEEYYVMLSDKNLTDGLQEGGHYYILDFYQNPEATALPDGTYKVSETIGSYVIRSSSSYYGVYGEGDFNSLLNLTDGSLTVSNSDDVTTIEGILTDEDGTVHYVYYSGTIGFNDFTPDSDSNSTVTENITVNADGSSCKGYYFGDEFDNGSAFWFFRIYKYPGEAICMAYFGDSSFTAEKGLPTGEFTGASASEAKEGNYITGEFGSNSFDYSWYLTINALSFTIKPYSPLGDGTVTVTDNGDGTYTINVDVKDASGNYSIKATWTGTPTIKDSSASSYLQSLKSSSLQPASLLSLQPTVSAGKTASPLTYNSSSKKTFRFSEAR